MERKAKRLCGMTLTALLAGTCLLSSPAKADVAAAENMSDAELTTIISDGKGKMPAYAKSLKPDQVKDLVAYVRSFAKK
jgi:mono/diheme cytochrome c family protein